MSRKMFPLSTFSQTVIDAQVDQASDKIVAGFAKCAIRLDAAIPPVRVIRAQDPIAMKPAKVRLGDYQDSNGQWYVRKPDGTSAECYPLGCSGAMQDSNGFWYTVAPFPADDTWLQTEGFGGQLDRHGVVIVTSWDGVPLQAWETWEAWRDAASGQWKASMVVCFNPLAGDMQRPWNWSSANAFGGSIASYVLTYAEAVRPIQHAVGITIAPAHNLPYWCLPAACCLEGSPQNPPPTGLLGHGRRLRLRADFDLRPFSPVARNVLVALQDYGAIIVDQGADLMVTVDTDKRWSLPSTPGGKSVAQEIAAGVTSSDLEVLAMPANCGPFNYQNFPK